MRISNGLKYQASYAVPTSMYAPVWAAKHTARWAFAAVLSWALALWGMSAGAWAEQTISSTPTQTFAAPQALDIATPIAGPWITLDYQGLPRSVGAQALWWYDTAGQATISQVAGGSSTAKFAPHNGETMYPLRPGQQLWARLVLERPASASQGWKIWVPLPLIDRVTLYEPLLGTGQAWRARTAGDKVAVSSWPEYGRYPRFHLGLPAGQTVVYLKIEGSTPISLPIMLANEAQAQQVDHLAYLGLGVVMGALMLLVALCFVMGYTYRDNLYAVYGLYGLLMVLAVGSYTGLAAQILWNNSPVWADAAQGALASITAGAALFFIDVILAVKRYAPRMTVLLRLLGALGPVLCLAYLGLERNLGVMALGLYMVAVTALGLYLSITAWRRGDVVGRLVFFAYTPLAFTVLLAVMRAQGWIPISWLVQYGVIVAMMIEVPLLMVALNMRSRERHSAQTRSEAMATQDALTGLLAGHLFQDRVQQAVLRARSKAEPAAVVLVSLVNYHHITTAHGTTVAEQSILRSVIKLRRVLRDVDTASRVGPSHFGLILEGAKHRDNVTQVAARLIALGLMPLKGLVPEVTLQFQFSAVLLHETDLDAQAVQQQLQATLARMSPRTRRPIRFLAAAAGASGLQPTSGGHSGRELDIDLEMDSILPRT